MTHQYESEILNKLMERDGFNIPSSVPPYESEIKAYLIEQVKLAYPKLNDYEAEWLLYNYTKHIPAEFPLETITNVNNATVDNVVPYAYKSAILKGNTLVNMVLNPTQEYVLEQDGSSIRSAKYNLIDGIENDSYTVMFEASNVNLVNTDNPWVVYINTYSEEDKQPDNKTIKSFIKNGKVVVLYSPSRKNKTTKEININLHTDSGVGSTITIKNLVILKGDYTNIANDIPFFEGMKSVQMPVLTTTGKNLFDKEAFYNDWKSKQPTYMYKEIVDGEEVLKINNLSALYNDKTGFKIFVKKDVPLTLSLKCKKAGTNNTSHILIIRYGESSYVGAGFCTSDEWSDKKVTFTPTRDYITICSGYNINDYFYIKDIQLEVGSDKTPYEPYKTNILTVNEDVELRGIGEVKDELNLMTGEMTERIGEVVLDGTQSVSKAIDYGFGNNYPDSIYSVFRVEHGQANAINDVNEPKMLMSDCLKSVMWRNHQDIPQEAISNYHRTSFTISVLKSRLEEDSISGFNQWLQSNPITVQYRLETESVKTVDLSVVDESGNEINYFMPIEGTMHIQTDGEPIKPSVTMEIPVEATTQNLASFIEMEV